jgi:hypothetical protein
MAFDIKILYTRAVIDGARSTDPIVLQRDVWTEA